MQCQEHALLVVAGGRRSAGRKDDLAAIAIDIGSEERHAVAVGRFLYVAHQLLQRECSRPHPLLGDEQVHAVVVEESHRYLAMLRLDEARPEVRADGTRDRL